VDNVRRAVKSMRVDYPVAIDNDYAIWRAFDNHYWPALYFADAQGHIRHHHFGEGEYQQSEMVIRQLLAEAGYGDISHDPVRAAALPSNSGFTSSSGNLDPSPGTPSRSHSSTPVSRPTPSPSVRSGRPGHVIPRP
jgi:hypothetical protein